MREKELGNRPPTRSDWLKTIAKSTGRLTVEQVIDDALSLYSDVLSHQAFGERQISLTASDYKAFKKWDKRGIIEFPVFLIKVASDNLEETLKE